MNTFIVALLLFAGGIAILLFSGNVLTRFSLRLAKFFNISPLVAGLTITAFATSAPEAAIAVHAAFEGNTDIVLGNIIGSNTANILLVLGLPALFLTLNMNIKHLHPQFLMVCITSLLFLAVALWGSVERAVGIGFLLFLLLWIIYSFKSGTAAEVEEEIGEDGNHILSILGCLGAALGLWVGANLTLNGVREIALMFDISDAVIGLTLIAIGTSLPELAASAAALWQKRSDLAIGSILGSHFINILFVAGLSAVITPLPFDKKFLVLDMPVMLGAVVLLAPFVWFYKPLTKIYGGLFFGLYIIYMISLIELRPTLVN